LEQRTYSQEEKDRVYELMQKDAEKQMNQGKEVILDATFYLERYREQMRDVAKEKEMDFRIIECTLDEDELKRRIEKRREEKTESEADFEIYLKVKSEFEPIKEDHLVIDTNIPIEENINKAIEWMKNK
jgi:predicted kinase